MKRLGTYLLQGILLIAPLAATVYIVYFLFQFTDGLLSVYLEKYFENQDDGHYRLVDQARQMVSFIHLNLLSCTGDS